MSLYLTAALERSADRNLPAPLSAAVATALEHLREGCFQRSLCLIVATTSVASGLEVGYEHYKGSYSNPVMYTPVVLSGALAGAGLLGAFTGGLLAPFCVGSASLRLRMESSDSFFMFAEWRENPEDGAFRYEHRDGTADLRPTAVWNQRLSGTDGLVSAAGGRSS